MYTYIHIYIHTYIHLYNIIMIELQKSFAQSAPAQIGTCIQYIQLTCIYTSPPSNSMNQRHVDGSALSCMHTLLYTCIHAMYILNIQAYCHIRPHVKYAFMYSCFIYAYVASTGIFPWHLVAKYPNITRLLYCHSELFRGYV